MKKKATHTLYMEKHKKKKFYVKLPQHEVVDVLAVDEDPGLIVWEKFCCKLVFDSSFIESIRAAQWRYISAISVRNACSTFVASNADVSIYL